MQIANNNIVQINDLSFYESEESSMNAEAKPEKELDLADFRVLVVEDFPFISEIITTSLRHMGVGDVLAVEDGGAAQSKLRAFNSLKNDKNIDIVIMDWLMPEVNGAQLLEWIRTHKSELIRFLPVIVCSAYTSEKIVTESRDSGANEVIVKPVSAKELAKRVQYVINNPRSFVKASEFFGPDRRRQTKDYKGDDKRKMTVNEVKNTHERD